jgi:DNA-binding NarL/FixJ family response regulator
VKTLVIEAYSAETQVFMEELNAATGCNVYHAQSVDAGLRVVRDQRPDAVLVNLDQLNVEGWQVVERIRCEAREARERCPYVILLSARPRPVSDAAKCRELQAVCMFREFWPAIWEELRIVFWVRQFRKHKSTIRIEFNGASYSLHFSAGRSSTQMRVAARPAELAVLLARGRESYTVEEIADALGVCRQTVKKYMRELREASLQAQRDLLVSEPDTRIFWMERRAGGTICGVKANIIRD